MKKIQTNNIDKQKIIQTQNINLELNIDDFYNLTKIPKYPSTIIIHNVDPRNYIVDINDTVFKERKEVYSVSKLNLTLTTILAAAKLKNRFLKKKKMGNEGNKTGNEDDDDDDTNHDNILQVMQQFKQDQIITNKLAFTNKAKSIFKNIRNIQNKLAFTNKAKSIFKNIGIDVVIPSTNDIHLFTDIPPPQTIFKNVRIDEDENELFKKTDKPGIEQDEEESDYSEINAKNIIKIAMQQFLKIYKKIQINYFLKFSNNKIKKTLDNLEIIKLLNNFSNISKCNIQNIKRQIDYKNTELKINNFKQDSKKYLNTSKNNINEKKNEIRELVKYAANAKITEDIEKGITIITSGIQANIKTHSDNLKQFIQFSKKKLNINYEYSKKKNTIKIGNFNIISKKNIQDINYQINYKNTDEFINNFKRIALRNIEFLKRNQIDRYIDNFVKVSKINLSNTIDKIKITEKFNNFKKYSVLFLHNFFKNYSNHFNAEFKKNCSEMYAILNGYKTYYSKIKVVKNTEFTEKRKYFEEKLLKLFDAFSENFEIRIDLIKKNINSNKTITLDKYIDSIKLLNEINEYYSQKFYLPKEIDEDLSTYNNLKNDFGDYLNADNKKKLEKLISDLNNPKRKDTKLFLRGGTNKTLTQLLNELEKKKFEKEINDFNSGKISEYLNIQTFLNKKKQPKKTFYSKFYDTTNKLISSLSNFNFSYLLPKNILDQTTDQYPNNYINQINADFKGIKQKRQNIINIIQFRKVSIKNISYQLQDIINIKQKVNISMSVDLFIKNSIHLLNNINEKINMKRKYCNFKQTAIHELENIDILITDNYRTNNINNFISTSKQHILDTNPFNINKKELELKINIYKNNIQNDIQNFISTSKQHILNPVNIIKKINNYKNDIQNFINISKETISEVLIPGKYNMKTTKTTMNRFKKKSIKTFSNTNKKASSTSSTTSSSTASTKKSSTVSSTVSSTAASTAASTANSYNKKRIDIIKLAISYFKKHIHLSNNSKNSHDDDDDTIPENALISISNNFLTDTTLQKSDRFSFAINNDGEIETYKGLKKINS